MTTSRPVGPPIAGIELEAEARIDADGWSQRGLYVPDGLDGPEGVLQGGLAAGVCIDVARALDPHGAPLTSLDARLHAPTPQQRSLRTRARAAEGVARYEVEAYDGDRLLVTATVELAGHDPAPQVADLAELARVSLPPVEPQSAFTTCVICGPHPRHALGQQLYPGFRDPQQVVTPWVPDEALGRGGHRGGGGHVDDLLVAAALDCPTLWSTMSHLRARGHTAGLLAQYGLRVHADAPVMEPLRTVARMDGADGRKLHARGALLDEDGRVYAVTSAMHVAVPAVA